MVDCNQCSNVLHQPEWHCENAEKKGPASPFNDWITMSKNLSSTCWFTHPCLFSFIKYLVLEITNVQEDFESLELSNDSLLRQNGSIWHFGCIYMWMKRRDKYRRVMLYRQIKHASLFLFPYNCRLFCCDKRPYAQPVLWININFLNYPDAVLTITK